MPASASRSSGTRSACSITSNCEAQRPRCSTMVPSTPSQTATKRSAGSSDASLARATTTASTEPHSAVASISAALSSASLEPKW